MSTWARLRVKEADALGRFAQTCVRVFRRDECRLSSEHARTYMSMTMQREVPINAKDIEALLK